MRGATNLVAERLNLVGLFQSTHPVRGATVVDYACRVGKDISIHAPRAGCDFRKKVIFFARFVRISIHAPRAGCDRKHAQLGAPLLSQLRQIGCMLTSIILLSPRIFNRKRGFLPLSAVRSPPENHVCFRFAPRQSISSPSGA